MNVKNLPDHHPSIGVDAFYTPREQQLGQEAFQKEALKVMNRIQNQTQQQMQQYQEVDTMPIFTFLRDPVPRFLSSIGQALRLGRLHPCNVQSNGTIELVHCVLAKIDKTQSFLDEHLIPQVFELYMGMMGLDLSVTVMDLSHLSTALEGLFGSTFVLGSHSAIRRRKSPTLVRGFNLSLAVLPPTLIDQICQLYRVDVLLLHMTRVSTTICE
jgi:hypothetical protein